MDGVQTATETVLSAGDVITGVVVALVGLCASVLIWKACVKFYEKVDEKLSPEEEWELEEVRPDGKRVWRERFSGKTDVVD